MKKTITLSFNWADIEKALGLEKYQENYKISLYADGELKTVGDWKTFTSPTMKDATVIEISFEES